MSVDAIYPSDTRETTIARPLFAVVSSNLLPRPRLAEGPQGSLPTLCPPSASQFISEVCRTTTESPVRSLGFQFSLEWDCVDTEKAESFGGASLPFSHVQLREKVS